MAIEISALADTWNSSGTAKYAIKFDVTDTASATASKLLELMVASSSKFGVRKDGRVNFASGTLFDSSGDGGGAFKTSAASSLLSWDTSGNTTLAGTLGSGAITSTGNVTAGASSAFAFSAGTQIAPNGDGGLYIKNAAGTTVFTFASDGAISTGGTITGGTVSAATVSGTTATFSGNVTAGASSAFQISGRTKFVSGSDGAGDFQNNAGTSKFTWDASGNVTLAGNVNKTVLQFRNDAGTAYVQAHSADSGSLVVSSGMAIGWRSSLSGLGGSNDAVFYRDSAGVIAQRNSTNAQKFIWSHSYTNSSNYQQGALKTAAAYIEVAAETAGTGADDIDVLLTPAGAGNVRFGTHSAIAAETVTGYITIKDSGGTSRKIAVVS